MATTNINVRVDTSLKEDAETIAALSEYEEMKRNPEKYKRYDSFHEVLDEVLTDLSRTFSRSSHTFSHTLIYILGNLIFPDI